MENNQYAIAFHKVDVYRGGTPVLKKIDWEVEKGGRVVVLGLNGSGKTTLLRLIAGYGYPTKGELFVLGKRFGRVDLRELRKKVGWVHMDLKYEIPPFMKVREVVVSGIRGSLVVYDDLSKKERYTVEKYLAVVNASRLADRNFVSLSTGERQRILIARALSVAPEILLLDEPCLGLDPVSREEFLLALSRITKSEKELTIVYVTHHVEEILDEFNDILVLKDGKVLRQGETGEVLKTNVVSNIYGSLFSVTRQNGRYKMHLVT